MNTYQTKSQMQKLIDVTQLPTHNRNQNRVTMDDDTSRLDAIAKVTGQAKFSIDHTEDEPIVAAFVRCPWGRATLSHVDIQAAMSVSGVLEVQIKERIGKESKYHGHNAGYIAAHNIHALKRGLTALNCTWKIGKADTGFEHTAVAMPTLSSKDEVKLNNTLAKSDHVVDAVYTTQVQTHSCMETHGCRVDYFRDHAVVYASTQTTYGARDGLANVLKLPQSAIEVRCDYIGGGFGSKLMGAGKEGHLAARLAIKYNSSCIVFCNRAEEQLDTGNRPSSKQHFRVGITHDGQIVGGMKLTLGGTGVASRGGGVSGYRYRLGSILSAHKDVTFNAGAPRPMRAPGHPQAMFGAELLMDELAAKADIDPLILRLKHDPSKHRIEMYHTGAKLIGWNNRKPNGSQSGAVKIGYGIGIGDWSQYKTSAEAEVLIHPDGAVECRSGTQDIGQGHRTVVGVLTASTLGIPLNLIDVKIASTNYPPGPASGGSMTAHNTAPAIIQAAKDAKDALRNIIAEQVGVDVDGIEIRDGRILSGTNNLMSWFDACQLLPKVITGRGKITRKHSDNTRRGEGHSEGVQFAKVHVDTEIGQVNIEQIVAIQSCGKVICKKTAESQILGAVIQGVSYALLEDRILDRNTAAMVNPDLEYYKIAGSVDIPDIIPILWDADATGVRSLGEPPTIPTAGAIACAIYNAIGYPVRALPITPDKVLEAVHEAAAGKGDHS